MSKEFMNPEFGQLEVVIIDDKEYFAAVDCAKILGYKKPHDAIATHCPHALKRGVGVQTGTKADGTPAMQIVEKLFIPEGDLYRLIARSKLPAAEKFERWVFDEVLPSIRKHGSYGTRRTGYQGHHKGQPGHETGSKGSPEYPSAQTQEA